MKKVLVVTFLALAVAWVVLSQPQTAQPPKPAPEVQRLSYFVGTWKYDGDFLTEPKGAYGGRMTCEWFPGGFSVVCRAEGTGVRGQLDELHIFSYSTTGKTYTWYSAGRTGAARMLGNMSVEGSNWTCEGDQP